MSDKSTGEKLALAFESILNLLNDQETRLASLESRFATLEAAATHLDGENNIAAARLASLEKTRDLTATATDKLVRMAETLAAAAEKLVTDRDPKWNELPPLPSEPIPPVDGPIENDGGPTAEDVSVPATPYDVSSPTNDRLRRIVVEDGRFVWPNVNGSEPVRLWGVNVVGWAITASRPEDIDAEIESLAKMGVGLIRLLHLDGELEENGSWRTWYANGSGVEPDGETLRKLDFFVDACRRHKVYAWITTQHRRRLYPADAAIIENRFGQKPEAFDRLFGGRPSGKKQGELAELWLFDQGLRELVAEQAVYLCNRVNTVNGIRYGADPTVAFWSVANETTSTISQQNYYIGDAVDPADSIKVEWFRLWAEFNLDKGLKGRKPDIAMFNTWLDRYNFMRVTQRMRPFCVGLINSTALFGDRYQGNLLSQYGGDFDDVHIYPEPGERDPFLPTRSIDDRSFASVAAATKTVGRPRVFSEWGSIIQSDPPSYSETFGKSSLHVADIAAAFDIPVVCLYAWASAPLHEIKPNQHYDLRRHPQAVDDMKRAIEAFHTAPRPTGPFGIKTLYFADAFGVVDKTLPPKLQHVTQRPGSQLWARERGLSLEPLDIEWAGECL